MNNENIVNVLDELNKGASMGVDAICFIIDKVKDKKLESELKNQYKQYKSILDEISKIYPEYSSKEPHETNAINKVMTWYGIEMKTFLDKTTSKIAELLMQGTNMGIIEGRRLLNKNDTPDEVHRLIQEYVSMQEKAVENLKKFL